MSSRFVWIALLIVPLAVAAQSAPPQPSTTELQVLASVQFGPEFEVVKDFPVLIGDFNGDGIEDAAFVATTHGGFQMQSGQFRVLDPASSYFGLGDPKITAQFASKYPGGPRYLLIIHGSGSEGWHAKNPKDKFVIINLAFDHLSVGHIKRKKKILDDIGVEETGILNSFLFWNGRRYEWQPGASEL
ncbi:MAG TPA: hypothetical protein VJT08_03765 [Terriglobales bacterium]|nr:hypothetical protein [Terriglobales bacterium]